MHDCHKNLACRWVSLVATPSVSTQRWYLLHNLLLMNISGGLGSDFRCSFSPCSNMCTNSSIAKKLENLSPQLHIEPVLGCGNWYFSMKCAWQWHLRTPQDVAWQLCHQQVVTGSEGVYPILNMARKGEKMRINLWMEWACHWSSDLPGCPTQ